MDDLMVSYCGLVFFDPELRQELIRREQVARPAPAAHRRAKAGHWLVKALQTVAGRLLLTTRVHAAPSFLQPQ